MRKPRPPIPGGIFHVTAHGVDKRKVFPDEFGCIFFLTLLARVVQRLHWECWSWCLLGTHYHLGVTTPEANLSRGMQYINGVYAQRYNKFAERRGHLFEMRFHSEHIVTDAHLFQVIRYIPLNPVRAGLCTTPAAWKWSSYRAIAGLEGAPSFLNVERTLQLFGRNERSARDAFRTHVAAGMVPDVA